MKMIAFSTAAVLFTSGAAMAQLGVNGFNNQFRNFNDFGNSTLAAASSFPARTISISESNFGTPTGGTFANRHIVLASTDGGATPASFPANTAFDVTTDLTVSNNTANPTGVEAGIYFNNPGGGEPRYIIKPNDAAFAFDGFFPFSFATGLGGQSTVTAQLRLIYTPGDAPGAGPETTAARVRVLYNGVQVADAPVENFNNGNEANGFSPGFNIGFVAQFSPGFNGTSTPPGSASATFSNISIVPAPGVAALGLLGLATAGRRRR